jgi:TetR/AcrR family transcriptional repressor of bet genes
MTERPAPAAADPDTPRDAAREAILKAAVRVMSDRGADNARLRDIARASGLSIGALQHHFDSRDELVAEAFRRFNTDSIRTYQESARTGDPRARLAALVELCVVTRDSLTFREKWSIWLEFWSASNRDPDLLEQCADIYSSWREPFHRAIQDGAAQGIFHPRSPIDDIVDRVIATIDGLSIRSLLEPGRVSPNRMVNLLTTSLETELGAR